jgi:cell division protein FtsI (penicillin-binding protein 3)
LNKKIKAQEQSYAVYDTQSQKNYKVIPDLKGMSGMDAAALLGNLGMTVNVIGIGKVKKQSIQPGQNLDKNTIITLELS